MKYGIFLYLLITLFNLENFAQERLIGVNFKISSSTIEPKEQWGDGLSNRNGIGFGLSYNRILENNLNISLELAYEEKGIQGTIFYSDSVGQFNGTTSGIDYYFNYLSLPMMLGYSFGNKFRVIPEIGFRASYLLNAETKFPNIVNQKNTGDIKTDRTEDIRSFDFGVAFNLNCVFFIENNIALELGYNFDQSITEFDENNLFSTEESKHRYSGFEFGIKYLLKE